MQEGAEIKCAVIGIAGPVFGGQLSYQLNIKHWCPIREKDLEEQTGLKKIVLLNDFVSNGYGVLDLDQQKEISTVYQPEGQSWADDNNKLVLGIGTGLGSCQLTKAPQSQNYHVNSLEAGM